MKQFILVFLAVLSFQIQLLAQQAGSIDSSFNFGRGSNYQFNFGYGANRTILSSALLPDGKILIAGEFTSYNGILRNRIARLNTDGSLDNTFNPGNGGNDRIRSVSIQADGKILVAGDFTVYEGNTRTGIARLNADGSLDNTFNATAPGTNGNVYTTVLQPDGKILIGGSFTSYNGTNINNLARLNADGTIDNNFNPSVAANIILTSIALQSDGKIFIGCAFRNWPHFGTNRIVKLNSDGSIDNTFNTVSGFSVSSIVLQADGKILFGCSNPIRSSAITDRNFGRLNLDGSLDSSFNIGLQGANNFVNSIRLQLDGKILIGGDFTSYNGINKNQFARLNSNGSLDTSFNATAIGRVNTILSQTNGQIIIGVGGRIERFLLNGNIDNSFNPATGANGPIQATAFQSDGKILIGGRFTRYNGIDRDGLARLNRDGSLDSSFNFNFNSAPSRQIILTIAFAIQSDGKVLIGPVWLIDGRYSSWTLLRSNSDGSGDVGFRPHLFAKSITLQSDGKVLIVGRLSSSSFNIVNRYNSDGTIDATFNYSASGNVNSLALQSDGKILIAVGDRIVRLFPNGSLDSFISGPTLDNTVEAMTLQPDGKILIGGSFTSYNGTARNGIARLNANGSLDNSFNPGTGINGGFVKSIVLQPDSKILIGGSFTSYNGITRNSIARLNTDGGLDTNFNAEFNADSIVNSIALQEDGNILIGGGFTSYKGTNNICRILGSGRTTSISNRENKSTLALYPNPASTHFIVEVTKPTSLRVLNNLGQVVILQAIESGSNVINTSKLPSGLYTVLAEGYSASNLVVNK